jgi:hypothetical protein
MISFHLRPNPPWTALHEARPRPQDLVAPGQDTEVVNARHESVSQLDAAALKGFPNALVRL